MAGVPTCYEVVWREGGAARGGAAETSAGAGMGDYACKQQAEMVLIVADSLAGGREIGRASCRDRVSEAV